jgi:histone-lysine N-methyltransferase SUV420H
MRHFAIYAQPWPSRAPEHVAAWLLTPRECTPVDGLTKRASLSTLDRKLSAAISSSKLGRQDSVQSSKKGKISERSESNRGLSRYKQYARIGCSHKKLSKLSIYKPPPMKQIARIGCPTNELPKRKRGRPRLTSPRHLGKDPKIPVEQKAEAAPNQPRDTNGRFGKKGFRGRYMGSMFPPGLGNVVMSRAQRAIERDKVKAWLERRAQANDTEEDSVSRSLVHKRCASHLDGDGRAGKRIRRNEEDNEDASVDVMRRSLFGFGRSPFRFKGMGLLHTPNPMSFARLSLVSFRDDSQSHHAMDVTITSDDETDVPETPEDKLSAPSVIIDDSESGLGLDGVGVVVDGEIRVTDPFRCSPGSKLPQASQPVGALTFKPSPFNFARRRWVPTSVPPDSTNDDNTAPESRGPDNEGLGAMAAAPSEKLSCHPWSRDYDSSSCSEEVCVGSLTIFDLPPTTTP